MRFNFLKCREAENKFDLIWRNEHITEQTITANATLPTITSEKEVST